MNLENIYFISQTLASFGVLVSIIYLTIQLKLNTKEIRQRAVSLTSSELRNMLGMLATEGSLGKVFNKAAISDNLSSLERLQWYTFIGNSMRIFENSYDLMINSDLNKDYWIGIEAMLIDLTNMKAFNDFWIDRKHWYGDEFRNYMEASIILESSLETISPPGNYKRHKKSKLN